MFQLNLPRKYTALGQALISFALIILATIFVFTPIVQIDLSDSDMKEAIDELFVELNEDSDEELEIPDKVGVSAPKLISSISVFSKVIKVAAGAVESSGEGDDEALKDAEKELEKIIESKEGQETIAMVFALVVGVVDMDAEFEDVDDSMGYIVNTIISVIALAMLLGYIFIMPIVMIICAIVALVRAIKAIKAPEDYASKLGAGLMTPLVWFVTVSLLLCMLPNIELGSGMIAILVLAIISIVVNVAATRLRAYNPLDFKYATIVQGTGLIKLAGFIVYFTSVLNAGFLKKFINSLMDYIVDATKGITDINNVIDIHNQSPFNDYVSNVTFDGLGAGYVIELLLMVLAAIFAFSVCLAILKNVVKQIGLTDRISSKNAVSLASGIFALIVPILPLVVSNFENKNFYKMEYEGGELVTSIVNKGSIFYMDSDAEAALVGMFVGAALLIVADIAYMILKKIFCKGITAEQAGLVLSGNAPALVTAEAVAEEAVAEEAVAEEAVAEEAVAEEAVAEEAPAEEAVAEEAPAEEAPAEEAVAEEAPAEEVTE